MAKQHVNIETGEYGKCEAEVRPCPLGKQGIEIQVDTVAEARQVSEGILKELHGETNSLSKRLDAMEPSPAQRVVPPASDIQPSINHRYPYPEAHKLDKVDLMLHGLREGATPPEGISSILGTRDRVSDFYGEAASFLGLAHAVKDDHGKKAFMLTQDGADYLEQDIAGRQEILARTINGIDILDTVRAGDADDAAIDRISSTHGESRETSSRKLSSLRSWARQVQEPSFLNHVDQYAVESQLAESMELYHRKQKEAVAPPEKFGEICNECFMVKPLTGKCPDCDD